MLAAKDVFGELSGVIALLILGAASALANWLKNRAAHSEETEKGDPGEEPLAPLAPPRKEATRTMDAIPPRPIPVGPSARKAQPRMPPVVALPVNLEEFLRPVLRREPRREVEKRVPASFAMQPAAPTKPPARPRAAAAEERPRVVETRFAIDLHDASEMRRAVVLSEILAPPLALRDEI